MTHKHQSQAEWLCLLQLTTQQGMTAGLEADQAAKLAHIDALKRDGIALQAALDEQKQLTQGAESALDATQAELSHLDLATEGQLKACRHCLQKFYMPQLPCSAASPADRINILPCS